MCCLDKPALPPCAVIADTPGQGMLCDVSRHVFVSLKMEAGSLVIYEVNMNAPSQDRDGLDTIPYAKNRYVQHNEFGASPTAGYTVFIA